MKDCIFCKIVNGEIPSAKIWEDDKFFVFHDTFPIKMGHALIIPKEHHPYVFELPDELICSLMMVCKSISKVLLAVYKPKSGKIGAIIAGEAVNHAHIHLIPMDYGSDLNLTNPNKDISFEALQAEAEKIRKAMKQ